VSSLPQAISKAYLTRNWGFYSLNAWAERREQLVQDPVQPTAYGQPILATVENTIVRWVAPEIEFCSRRQRIGPSPFFIGLESTIDHLDKGETDTSYERADVYPQLTSQLSPVPWIDINANASVRDTYYTRSQAVDLGCDNLPDTGDYGEGNAQADIERDNDPIGVFGPEDDLGCDNLAATGDYGEGNGVRDRERTLVVDDSLDRRIYQAGLTVIGPKVSRVFDTPHSDFSPQYKNSIEPTLRYTYVSSIKNPTLIIPFDEIDTVPGESNRLTYGFTTRLYARRPVTAVSEVGFDSQVTPGATGSLQDALAEMLRKAQEDRAREAADRAGDAGTAAAGAGTTTAPGAPGAPTLNTVEVATLEIVQDYSFLGPLSVSAALGEKRPVSPVRGTLRVNPSINTSIDLRTSFDVLFRQVRDASLSANLRAPGRGFIDLTWTMARDLEGKALEEQGLAFAAPFDRSQLGLTGEATLFARRVLVGFQINYEMGDILPGQPRMRDQRYRAGYNTQCCGFQFEYLNRNFSGTDQEEFRFLINLKGVGNVIDFHQRTGGGGW
jgi:hypothetical protein